MGLDVYVGTLTRYYAGEWQTVVQQAGGAMGLPVTVIRQNSPPDAAADPLVIENAVNAWREAVNAGLDSHLTVPLNWTEGIRPPFFTDKPAWDCYSALLVWAAHDEHPNLPLPAVPPEDWKTDAAVQRSQAEGFVSRYGQLLYGPELWLPGDFAFTFAATDLGGVSVIVGSVNTLLTQLQDLNRRTWQAAPAEISEARRTGAESGAPLETSARFAFAVFIELAQAAATHRLPMKLDY
jgi:hypothetical protein